MLRIGITGGIGSGKTTICKLFELLGIPVFYADTQAKALMQADPNLINLIKSEFGSDIYSPDGNLDKKKLATIVFNNESRLAMLNSFVHPAVIAAFTSWAPVQIAPYVIKEAALLFESESYIDCDFIILVRSPKVLKISRVITRDQTNEESILKRMEKQLDDDAKAKRANFIIENNERTFLIPQVIKLHDFFLKRAAANDS